MKGGFLDGLTVEFDRGLNCIIGARGTGKTTVLEFLRYTLDVMPAEADHRKRLESLVHSRLGGGRLEVAVETGDGLAYTVSRTQGEDPMVLTADGRPTDMSLCHGALFRPQVFSQNDVEDIADDRMQQMSLLDSFESAAITAFGQQISATQTKLAENSRELLAKQHERDALAGELEQLPGIEERLKAFGSEGGEDAAAINQAYAARSLRQRERQQVDDAIRQCQGVRDDLNRVAGQVDERFEQIFTDDVLTGPNGDLMSRSFASYTECARETVTMLRKVTERLEREGTELRARRTDLDLRHKAQELAFRELVERHEEAQEKSAARTALDRQRNDLLAKKQQVAVLQERITALETNRDFLLAELTGMYHKRYEVRAQVARSITARLQGSVRVMIEQHGEPDAYRRLVEDALRVAKVTNCSKIVQTIYEA